MKVFISWSGAASHAAAKVLRDWLPDLLQALEPWVSSEDISKGSQWLQGISEELQQVRYGILCVTSDNFDSPWMCFEAGAMSVAKGIGRQHVAPVLLGLQAGELTGPLAQFQATEFSEAEVLKLAQSLNACLADNGLSEERLVRQFARLWPDLQTRIHATVQSSAPQASKRPPEEMLVEIVETVRALNRQIDRIESAVDTRRRMTAIDHALTDDRTLPSWNELKKWAINRESGGLGYRDSLLLATLAKVLVDQTKLSDSAASPDSSDPQQPAG